MVRQSFIYTATSAAPASPGPRGRWCYFRTSGPIRSRHRRARPRPSQLQKKLRFSREIQVTFRRSACGAVGRGPRLSRMWRRRYSRPFRYRRGCPAARRRRLHPLRHRCRRQRPTHLCGNPSTRGAVAARQAVSALGSGTAGAAAVSALTADAGLAADPAGPASAAPTTDVPTVAAGTAVATGAAVGAAAALTAQQA